MKEWLISIAAFSTLSAVADMLLPKSSVSRYAKLCISLVLTVILITPVLRLKNGNIDVILPDFEVDIDNSISDNMIDDEFSDRFTALLTEETGYEGIYAKVELDSDEIKSVVITGAEEGQKSVLSELLTDKYKVAAEKITYGVY